MLPSRWWFLPWTSAATAPPTVTWRVPGVTGHEPALRDDVRDELADADTGGDVDDPVRGDRADAAGRGEVEDEPAGVLAASP